MAKYIIEIEDAPSLFEGGFAFYKCVEAPWWFISDMYINRLKPYEDAERNTGRWLISEGACEPDYMECSRCKWITEYYGGLEEEWGYCPNCGADMRGEEHG